MKLNLGIGFSATLPLVARTLVLPLIGFKPLIANFSYRYHVTFINPRKGTEVSAADAMKALDEALTD